MLNRKFRLHPHIVIKAAENQNFAVLIDNHSANFYYCNECVVQIISLLQKKCTISVICEEILATKEVAKEIVLSDLLLCIEKLKIMGLIDEIR